MYSFSPPRWFTWGLREVYEAKRGVLGKRVNLGEFDRFSVAGIEFSGGALSLFWRICPPPRPRVGFTLGNVWFTRENVGFGRNVEI